MAMANRDSPSIRRCIHSQSGPALVGRFGSPPHTEYCETAIKPFLLFFLLFLVFRDFKMSSSASWSEGHDPVSARKRKGDLEDWDQDVAKRKRNGWDAYVSRRRKIQ